jgi:hypothetical protein
MKGYYDIEIGLELRHHGIITLFSLDCVDLCGRENKSSPRLDE